MYSTIEREISRFGTNNKQQFQLSIRRNICFFFLSIYSIKVVLHAIKKNLNISIKLIRIKIHRRQFSFLTTTLFETIIINYYLTN